MVAHFGVGENVSRSMDPSASRFTLKTQRLPIAFRFARHYTTCRPLVLVVQALLQVTLVRYHGPLLVAHTLLGG